MEFPRIECGGTSTRAAGVHAKIRVARFINSNPWRGKRVHSLETGDKSEKLGFALYKVRGVWRDVRMRYTESTRSLLRSHVNADDSKDPFDRLDEMLDETMRGRRRSIAQRITSRASWHEAHVPSIGSRDPFRRSSIGREGSAEPCAICLVARCELVVPCLIRGVECRNAGELR